MNQKHKQLVTGLVAVLALSLGVTSIAAATPQFTSSAYPATYKPSVGSGYGYVTTEAGSIECSSASASATLSEASSTLTIVEGAVSGCKAFGFSSATVSSNGCSSLVRLTEKTSADNYIGTVDLLCPAGKAVTTVSGTCETKVFPQTGSVTVKLTDDTGNGSVTVDVKNASVKYTVTNDGFLCPFNGTGEKVGGTFTQVKTGVIKVEGKEVSVSGS